MAHVPLHLAWAAVAAGLLGLSTVGRHDYPLLRVWATLTLLTGLVPPIVATVGGLLARRHPGPDPVEEIIHPHPDDPTAVLPVNRIPTPGDPADRAGARVNRRPR